MDDILRKLNLGTLVDRFNDEKVEVDTVISASDGELAPLSVCTIGIYVFAIFARQGSRKIPKFPMHPHQKIEKSD